MSRFLKNISDLEAFRAAIKQCRGDVILRSVDGTEEFNLKSKLSEFIALGKLADTHGDEYEIFCMDLADEAYLLKYFYDRVH